MVEFFIKKIYTQILKIHTKKPKQTSTRPVRLRCHMILSCSSAVQGQPFAIPGKPAYPINSFTLYFTIIAKILQLK